MFTRIFRITSLLFSLAFYIPFSTYAQDDRSLESVRTTAEYGEGQRQIDAQFELGYRYYTGTKGASQNYEKSAYWFKLCADKGNKPAMYNLYLCYDAESPIKNKDKSFYWLEQAANSYYLKASIIVGKKYYSGDGVAQDYYKAVRYIKDAAFSGDAEGMYYYAWCFAFGQGVQRDSTKAELWAQRAIEKGSIEAYDLLGRMYVNGESVAENKGYGSYWYEKGAEKGNSSCQNSLGVMYETGDYFEKDVSRAIDYYISASNAGNQYAMDNLSRIYESQELGYYNLNQAIYWRQQQFNLGKRSRVYSLTYDLKQAGKFQEAAKIYETIAQEGDADGYNFLAYLYAEGKLGQADYSKALSIIEKAIALNPNNPDYQDSKGEILLMKGDIKSARKIWNNINKKNPLYYQNWIKDNGETTVLDKYMKENSN